MASGAIDGGERQYSIPGGEVDWGLVAGLVGGWVTMMVATSQIFDRTDAALTTEKRQQLREKYFDVRFTESFEGAPLAVTALLDEVLGWGLSKTFRRATLVLSVAIPLTAAFVTVGARLGLLPTALARPTFGAFIALAYVSSFFASAIFTRLLFRPERQTRTLMGRILTDLLLGCLIGGFVWSSAHALGIVDSIASTSSLGALLGFLTVLPMAPSMLVWQFLGASFLVHVVRFIDGLLDARDRTFDAEHPFRVVGLFAMVVGTGMYWSGVGLWFLLA